MFQMRRLLRKIRQTTVQKDSRIVYALQEQMSWDTPEDDEEFCSNEIVTSRYRWFTIIPINLYEQYHNIANIFFSVIVTLHLFTDASTSVWASMLPLAIITLVTMIKDGFEDVLRHRSDRSLNLKQYRVLRVKSTPSANIIKWIWRSAETLSVGDVCMCMKDEAFPCDMVVLASSNPSKVLNVTTSNLDGEANIKRYYAVGATQDTYLNHSPIQMSHIPTQDDLTSQTENFYVRVKCQNPNEDLTTFEGQITTNSTTNQPLTTKNLVLRGAKLINTNFIVGLVVYTGDETKLSMNSLKAKRKYSSREAKANNILLAFISVIIIGTAILSTLYWIWEGSNIETTWYLPFDEDKPWPFMRAVFRFVFILNFLIPISIILTIDLQQVMNAFLISRDIQMYHAVDDKRAKANTSQLTDDLGQIEMLFSDKTGTLTQNQMSLCSCAILDGDKVHKFRPDQQQDVETTDSVDLQETDSIAERVIGDDADPGLVDSLTNDVDLDASLQRAMLLCALCHTVEVGVDESDSDKITTVGDSRRNLSYDSSSSDEKALVEGAASRGIIFLGSQPIGTDCSRCYSIEYKPSVLHTAEGTRRDYIVDAVLEFSSIRKRMSIMVRYPDGTFHIHSKGADAAMLSSKNCPPKSKTARQRALKHVTAFSKAGYRTLVFSGRQLDESEYNRLLAQFRKAIGLVGVERETAVRVAYGEIEENLEPLYVTAVEDTLQPGVVECLKDLRSAGIQVWLLTGDKEETAITVSQAAGHISKSSTLLRLTNCGSFEEATHRIFGYLREIRPNPIISPAKSKKWANVFRSLPGFLSLVRYGGSVKKPDTEMEMTDSNGKDTKRNNSTVGSKSLIVDGCSLVHLLNPVLRDAFLDLCINVSTVLCCRMTPLQKSSVVKLVQDGMEFRGGKPVTAAIGDGGNDVAMLLQANIGIGIYGKEGLEAARAADYSIPEFRYKSSQDFTLLTGYENQEKFPIHLV